MKIQITFLHIFALAVSLFWPGALLSAANAADDPKVILPQPAGGAFYKDIPSNAGSEIGKDYALGAQDILSVLVMNHSELSVDQVTVTDGGRIQVPVAGELIVAGRTISQVQIMISRSLRSILLQPQVTVSLRQARPRLSVTAYVDGFVKSPGLVQLDDGAGVVQAIAQAGGMTVPLDNRRVVASVRRGQEMLKVDLERLAFDPDANLPLRRGDVLLLAEPPIIRVQITGPVAKPGELRLPPNSTVLEAIASAGNLTVTKDISVVGVLRTLPDGSRHALQLDPTKLFSMSDLGQNVVLKDGDVISISPRQSETVFIGGEVKTPGSYEFREGDDIADLISRAGGPTEWAKLSRVGLTRRDGSNQLVDAVQVIKAGGAKLGVPLQQSDYVVVPKNMDRVLVMQAVFKPGYYPIPEDRPMTVGEALAMAGGPKERARLKEVAVLRQAPDGVKRTIISLSETKTNKLATDLVLQNGDVIFVPDGKLKSTSATQMLASGAALLGGLF